MVFAVVDNDPFQVADLRADYRDVELVYRRRAVILSARLHTNAAFSEIGRALNKDHSNITRSMDAALRIWRVDDMFVELVERVAFRSVLRGRWRGDVEAIGRELRVCATAG